MNIKDLPEYNNEEEAEVAQILSITQSASAVAAVQEQLRRQAEQPSLSECEDCGEDIPEQRRLMIRGCTRCVYCQNLYERKKAGY